MKEKDELLNDRFLRELILNSTEETPSVDFDDRVMAAIGTVPAPIPAKQAYRLNIRSIVPYLLITLLLAVVVATSDLGLFRWLPGMEGFAGTWSAYSKMLMDSFLAAFSSKYATWALLVGLPAGILYGIDLLFTRRSMAS